MKPVRKLYLDPHESEEISRVTKWRWEKKLKADNLTQETQIHQTPYNNLTNDEIPEVGGAFYSNLLDAELDANNYIYVDHQNENINEDIFYESDDDTQKPLPCYIDNGNADTSEDTCVDTEVDTNTICFQESQIKKLDIMAMAAAYSFRHNLSKEALVDLLTLIDVLAGKSLKISPYFINQKFMPPEEAVIYHFYCTKCKQFLESWQKTQIKKHSLICAHCHQKNILSPNSENYFIMLDLKYQLEIFLNTKDIQNYLLKHNIDKESNDILDIHQGEIYKYKKRCSDFTYNFNTDGAPVFQSSKLSMWPIQLIINELPPKQRFRNVILAGIWFGKSEPNMILFMSKFVENATDIADNGITWIDNNGHKRNSKFLPLACSVDSVAKCMLQNFTQFNGFYGCPYCYHPGKIVKKQVKYPQQNEECYSERTPDSILHDMQEAFKGGLRVRGVKGPSALINLPAFNTVWGYSIDYMHCVLLGVVRMLMEIWTTYNYHPENKMYIGRPSSIKELNRRLEYITPPSEIHRLPRPVTERAKWKATEWRSWLLYYSLPCLLGILDETFLNHFMLLQNAIFILLQTRISAEDLENSGRMLKKFVQEFEILYGESSMNFNIHLLLHLTKSVKMCGPLWSSSCFSFETNIHNIKKQINGPRGIAKQVVYKFLKQQYLNKLADEHVYSPKCKEFLSLISYYKTPLESSKGSLKITPLGKEYNTTGLKGSLYYDAILINNIKYTTVEKVKSLRYNDSFVKLNSNVFCKILRIYKNEHDKFFLDVKSLKCNNSDLKNCFKIIGEGDNFRIHPEDILLKCIFIKTAENSQYVCEYPNNLETQ